MVDFDYVCKLTQPNKDERHSDPEIYNNHALQVKHLKTLLPDMWLMQEGNIKRSTKYFVCLAALT